MTLNPSTAHSMDDVRDLILVAASQLKEDNYDSSGGRGNVGYNRGGDDAKSGGGKARKAGNQKGKKQQKTQHQDKDASAFSGKCFNCKQKGHFRKYCPELTGKNEAIGLEFSKASTHARTTVQDADSG